MVVDSKLFTNLAVMDFRSCFILPFVQGDRNIGEPISSLQRNDQQFHTTEQDAGHPWQWRPGDSHTWQPWENRKSFFRPWTATGRASN